MDLSQQSITGRQFELNRRGYDPDAVDTHLADIAAAVALRESKMVELEASVASLGAKVQDANESEEALRLTLKAAAHAKEELLSGARDQVAAMEVEAAEKAEKGVAAATAQAGTIVGEAEEQAATLLAEAQARVTAMEDGARRQAGAVATAALAESEALVVQIEEMRARFSAAEEALASLQSESAPQLATARGALDVAIAKARETVDNPEALAAIAVAGGVTPVAATVPDVLESKQREPEMDAATAYDPPPEDAAESQAAEPEPVAGGKPMAEEPGEPERVEEPAPVAESREEPVAEDHDASEQPVIEEAADQPERHLEVVEAAESSADISDKVDRLLEELREVT